MRQILELVPLKSSGKPKDLGRLERPHVATEPWNNDFNEGNHSEMALIQGSELL